MIGIPEISIVLPLLDVTILGLGLVVVFKELISLISVGTVAEVVEAAIVRLYVIVYFYVIIVIVSNVQIIYFSILFLNPSKIYIIKKLKYIITW
jgi:hypothetical protein